MPTKMKLWRIEAEHPIPVEQTKLNLESRLEKWLLYDIDLINPNLLLIGQQIETSYGGIIDLLAIDPAGNIVILELKRDKTPRDIIAQTLDYASWIQDLGYESITEISNNLLKDTTLEQAFQEKFQMELPEVLNERHRIYIVASSLDSATERIVKYLSEAHDIDINIATFAYFKTKNNEFLGRSIFLDETEVQIRAESKSKRKGPRTWEELRELASENNVVDIYDKALKEFRPLFDGKNRTRTNVAFVGYMGEERAKNTIIGVYPDAGSNSKQGLGIMIYLNRLSEYFNITIDQIKSILGSPATESLTYNPNSTWYFNNERLDQFISLLKEGKKTVK